MRNVLIIKWISENSFEEFYAQQMCAAGATVWDIQKILPRADNKIKKFFQFIGAILSSEFRNKLSNFSKIILFADEIFWIIIFYFTKKRGTKLILWEWNSFGTVAKRQKHLNWFADFWTFDSYDAEINGWNLNTQFYFWPNDAKNTLHEKNGIFGRAFFVGADKGRIEILEIIAQKLTANNVCCQFYVLKGEQETYVQGIVPIEQAMPYEEVRKYIRECDYVVDLVKQGQVGLTVRVLEAAFYGKKLITNNSAIKTTNLYHKNNVFIINEDSWDTFPKFVKTEYHEISQEILEDYTFQRWVKRF